MNKSEELKQLKEPFKIFKRQHSWDQKRPTNFIFGETTQVKNQSTNDNRMALPEINFVEHQCSQRKD